VCVCEEWKWDKLGYNHWRCVWRIEERRDKVEPTSVCVCVEDRGETRVCVCVCRIEERRDKVEPTT
jgi:hypothetical protein